ncbi:MAG: RES domain-containing protein [Acidimicrobiia bacterium]|nr:RES domain-containing protein [Acidimicrobiia bacterium]
MDIGLAAPYAGTVWRFCSIHRDVLDPTGSTVEGGRFNLPDVPTLYFCDIEECSEAEYLKQLSNARQWAFSNPPWSTGIGETAARVFPPKILYSVEITLDRVLDLTDANTRRELGVDIEILAGQWDPCQAIGAAAFRAGIQATLSPSATNVGAVLAVYVDNLDQGTGFTELREVREWAAVDLG